MSAGGKSFKSNLEGLVDELELAFRWNRPSILIVVQRSDAALHKAMDALRASVEAAGRRVITLETSPALPDIPHRILESGDVEDNVYFVSRLDRGGGVDSYAALNLYRELFVDNHIKIVLWLTEEEANALPRLAPDFWAFRHRVMELANPPVKAAGRRLVPLMLWHEQDQPASAEELRLRILHHEELLASLPQTPESLALRLEEHYQLGRAYWAAGQPARALRLLADGIRLAVHPELSEIRARLLNGAALIAVEDAKPADALKIYQGRLAGERGDPIILMNMAVCLCALGRNHDGLKEGARATARDPENPIIWETLGQLQLATGRPDDALASLEKAVAVAPGRLRSHESLAVCYSLMGLSADAQRELEAAGMPDPQQEARYAILRHAIQGESQEALSLLDSAVQGGQISRAAVAHDANLILLLDPALDPGNP